MLLLTNFNIVEVSYHYHKYYDCYYYIFIYIHIFYVCVHKFTVRLLITAGQRTCIILWLIVVIWKIIKLVNIIFFIIFIISDSCGTQCTVNWQILLVVVVVVVV